MQKVVLKNTLTDIISKKRKTYNQFKAGKDNPQIRETMSRIDAEINAFSAVSDALNNLDYSLRCYL